MKHNLTILCLAASLIVNGQSNCTFEDLFPLEFGMTEGQVRAFLAKNENVIEDTAFTKYIPQKEWKKQQHLEGDSVLKSWLKFGYVSDACFDADTTYFSLKFADNYLYSYDIRLRYSGPSARESTRKFNEIVKVCESKFPYRGTSTEEAAGNAPYGPLSKGVWMSPSEEAFDSDQIESVEIDFYVEYSKERDIDNVESSFITFQYINLNGTRLSVWSGY